MKYNLLYYPDENLLQKAEKETVINEELFDLLDQMKQIMISNNGLGIASVQVGSNKNCFIMKELKSGDIKEFINPVIQEENGMQYQSEGCLSFPNIFLQVKRPEELVFTAQDRLGERKTYIVNGLESVCCQHEMQHLQGELFIDKVNRQQKRQAERLIEKHDKNS